MLEKGIEKYVTDSLRAAGYMDYKLDLLKKDHPDHLYIGFGTHMIIEFKKPGEEPREGQLHQFEKMARCGLKVVLCDNMDRATDIVGYMITIARLYTQKVLEDM